MSLEYVREDAGTGYVGQDGLTIVQDLEEIEEWNEFGELKDNIGPVPASNAAPPGGQTGVNIAPPLPVNPTATGGSAKISQAGPAGMNKAPSPLVDSSKMRALPGAAEIAAKNKPQPTSTSNPIDEPPKVETMSSAPADKEQNISEAKEAPKHNPAHDHLSAPASAIQSGTATPASEPASDSTEADSEAASQEAAGEEDSAAKGIQGLQVGEGAKVQQQSAKEGGDAGKSVED